MSKFPEPKLLDRTTPPHIITLVLLAGIGALNMSIFLPSLNGMSVYFDTDYSVMQWAVSGYFGVTAALQLVFGPLSDRFGRRPILLITLTIFVLATLGALLATDIAWFLFFRILQASVAASMALSRAAVRDVYPTDQAASKIGYVTMGMSVVPMLGPMIGGALDELFDWHAPFMFLLGSGLVVLLLTYFDLGETNKGTGVKFRDQVKTYPELFKSQRFWGYVICSAFSAGTYYALLGGASFVAGTVFSLTPSMTGMALGSPAVGYAVGTFLSGRYSTRYGINKLALTGCIITFVGMSTSLVFSLIGLSDAFVFFAFCTLLGLGNGLTMPTTTAGLLSVRPHLAGTASGLGAAIMMGGGAMLSALAGSMLDPSLGETPLLIIMAASGGMALLSILYVIRRNRILGEEF